MPEGTIVVTGANRGIGAAIAKDLVGRGLRIAALTRTGDATHGEPYSCDITDETSLAKVFADIAAKGTIVGLVNNAGLHKTHPSASLSTAAFEEIMRINSTAVFAASRIAYPYLKAAGGGTIVNIGSFFDKLGVVDNLAYCASKAAVGAITRCLAVEWARDRIRVLDVAPGYIETDLNRDFLAREKVQAWLGKRIPVGRAGHAEEVARLVGALISDAIPFLTGETIYLDGGQGMNH